MTDEAIAAALQVFREDVTMVRKAHNIPDSRNRRKPVIASAIKQILADDRQNSRITMTFESKESCLCDIIIL